MEKISKISLIALVIILLFIGCLTKDIPPLHTISDRFIFANNYQFGSGYWFAIAEDKIYRFGPSLDNSMKAIYRLENDKFLPVSTDDDELFINYLPIGTSGNWFYFWRQDKQDPLSGESELCCFSFSEMKVFETKVFVQKGERSTTFFSPDGSLYISISGPDDRFFVLRNGSSEEIKSVQDVYSLGEKQYELRHCFGEPSQLFEVFLGTETSIELPWAGERYLLPVEDGLILGNLGGEHLLYLISPSGEIKELFSIPCMSSETAITVYGDYVFLSVERWETNGSLGMLHFENDQLQGSYRINWKTGETIRFTDDLYKGLFILYEDYIIGSDEHGQIVLMDHEFQVLQQLKDAK